MTNAASLRGRRLLAASVAILVTAGGALLSGGAAHAAPIPGPVTEQNGSLTIHKHINPGFGGVNQNPDGSEGIDGKPLNGATFEVCAISGIDLIAGGNAAWNELNALGAVASNVTTIATTIGLDPVRNLTSCTSQTTATVAGVDGIATFPTLPVGAYLVRETAAPASIVERSAPFVVAIPTPAIGADEGKWLYDVHVYPKNQELGDPVKTIEDQGTAVRAGDPVKYLITQRVPGIAAGQTYNKLVITDTLDAKLTPGAIGDVSVSINGAAALVRDSGYTATWVGQKLTVTLTGALGALEEGDSVAVRFVATVNTNGEIVNTAIVNVNDLVADGRSTPPVVTRWGALDLTKFNATDATHSALVGAEFELWMGETAGAGCSTAPSGNVKITDLVSGGALGELGTMAGTTFTALTRLWVGDSTTGNDLQTRCYYVVETKAPAGFILPATTALRTTEFIVHPTVVAHADSVREIPNSQQEIPELPLTGGTVQIALVVGGASLIGAAIVLMLVSRRRIANQ